MSSNPVLMDLFKLLEKILAGEKETVEIEVPEENFNLLMLRILQAKAKKERKRLILLPTGARSKRMIAALGGEKEPKAAGSKKSDQRPAPKPKKARTGIFRRFVLIASLLLVILLFLGGGAYWAISYLPRAEVILTLNPIPLVKELSVAVNISAEKVDAEKGIIPGDLRTAEESGEKSVQATGTAIVGEKAKGTVTFVNCLDSPKTFTAGTVIKVEGKDLTYTIDADVSDVPARPDPETCGSEVGSITSVKIGSQYDQSVGIEFDFVGGGYANDPTYNVYIASGQSVAGGSSQEVTIVSADDQVAVLEELKKELTEEGKKSLASSGGIDEVVVEEAIKSEVTEKKFSHAVGEQTDKLTLSLTMKFTLITYKGSDMQELVLQSIGALVPAGFTLFPGETNIDPLEPKLSSNKLSFQAKVSARVVPEVDVEKIKADLAGRNPGSAQEYLSSLTEATAYELQLWPNLPEKLQRVPRNTGRITITLVTGEQ
ncbi:MAG: hypothetical protein BMS9Abin34_332 [Patescibacteria group bacterium]|nr:MAG: hypothetical protein BMS9Abin34_332 [Patescibacteria group bacterium]